MTVRSHLLRLAERRARLVERAQTERESLAALLARGDGAADWLAAGGRLLDELRRQPLLAAAGAVLLFALRPRRALGWLLKGWSAWRMVRGAQRWWQRIAAATATGTTAASARR